MKNLAYFLGFRQPKILWLMVLVGLIAFSISSVSAFTTNVLYNGTDFNTIENMTFTGSQTFQRNLTIPEFTFITRAYMNLSGFNPIIAYNLTQNKTLYFRFNESSGTNAFDEVSRTNKAFSAAPTWRVSSFGTGYGNEVKGKDGATVYLDTTVKQDATNPFSIEFRFNETEQPLSGYVMSDGYTGAGCGASSYGMGINDLSGTWFFITCKPDGSASQSGGTAMSLNSVHHIVAVFNITKCKVYEDGTLVDSWNCPNMWTGLSSHDLFLFRRPQTGVNQWNGSIDQLRIWNFELSAAQVLALNSSTNNDFDLFFEPQNFNVSLGTTPVFTYDGTFNQTNNRTSNLASIVNSYLSTCVFVNSNCTLPFYFHSGVTSIIQYSDLLFSNEGFVENSQSYNPTTTSGGTESFTINITYDSISYSGITTSLVYNGISYPSTLVGSGNNVVFNTTIIVPTVSAVTTYPFYWSIDLINASGDNFYNSTNHTQIVNPFGVDNCTLNNVTIFNFTLYDEDARTALNGTIELSMEFYNTARTMLVANFSKLYNYVIGTNNARVCVNGLNTTYSIDYTAKYYNTTGSGTNYATEYKYAQNIVISNTTGLQNVFLYDLLSTRDTPFQISVTGFDGIKLPNVIVDIQRNYVSLAQFISIESPLTASDGTAIGNLVAKTETYTFVVMYQGVILGTFSNWAVKCQNEVTNDCRIDLILSSANNYPQDFGTLGNLYVNVSLDKTTRILTMLFSSVNGSSNLVSWQVIQNNGFDNQTICVNSLTAVNGVFTCPVSTAYGNISLYAQIYSNGVYLGSPSFSFDQTPSDIFGGTRIILALLMYSTITLLFTGHPIGIVGGAVLGMFLGMIFHLVDGGTFWGNTSIVLWFVISGIIIVLYIKNKS